MSVNIFNKSTGSITQIAGNATGGGGTTVTVDNILSTTSENPVQNKVITEELNKKATQTTVDESLALKANSADVTASLTEKSDIGHTHDDRYYTETEIDTKLSGKIDSSIKGVANGVAELDSNGKVLTAQLPSYVDDVLEYSGISDFPTEGETGKIYVDTTTNKTYRWSGSTYIEISESIALGETSSTAYRGDRGKIAYDHSQSPHAPADAEANVQSDWNETDTTSDAYILNKPESLPANGGNADTIDGLHANEIASNPNLLVNPNFAINQRGITTADSGTGTTYIADLWYVSRAAASNDGGVITAAWDGVNGVEGYLQQQIEGTAGLFGERVSVSFELDGERVSATLTVPTVVNETARVAVANDVDVAISNYLGTRISIVIFLKSTKSHTVGSIKAELGSTASPFVPPDYAAELAKCQRFYQVRTTNDIDPLDLRPSMRTITDIKAVEGGYAYVAEL